jgi:diadenosine tetraphosphatase ApaH/serine/threonine PP2A family protein phosphatase
LKYAIISDVHANLEAVEACFQEIGKIKPDRIICLGDLVDYCAEPVEVIDIIKKNCDVVILGNHDEAQFRYEMIGGYRENAQISSVHTRKVITDEEIKYLKTLPRVHSENDLLFVHASPLDPKRYRYLLYEETAAENFSNFSEKICFIGHSHKPLMFELSAAGVKRVQKAKLSPDARYLINVGSVGQPRDGNPKLSFGWYDTDSFEYRNIRVDYDIKSASAKIRNEGLPAQLANRLFEGI